MTETERKTAAKKFVERWKNADYEIGQYQQFWLDLISSVYGEKDIGYIEFEKRVMVDGTIHRIDAYIPSTRVLIEHKSGKVNLLSPQPREGNITPYEQALNYTKGLSVNDFPKWIIICNFKEFYIYNMQESAKDRVPTHFSLQDLREEYKRLCILVDEKENAVEREYKLSVKAGKQIGNLYRELLKCYPNPNDDNTKKALNILCVRLVFCLYAEDADLFNEYNQFKSFIANTQVDYLHLALKELFVALNTKEDERKNVSPRAASFPYVNGGLFEEEIEIPVFSDAAVQILLENAKFNWKGINPTIFGAVFESTLNPDTRDENGMFFTSLENIHKVIDPLFLDDLKAELAQIKEIKVEKTRNARLEAFRTKLGSLTFLDPACGSGNFLTETYLSLRKLENEALSLIMRGVIRIDKSDFIKVSIKQFYGIEINDFAVTVAQTALWIAESQMMKKTEELVITDLDFLPLRSHAHIIEGNALRMDWENIVPKENLSYIMGNPPFVGGMRMSREQKSDMNYVLGDVRGVGELDYVAAWYFKAANFIHDTHIEAAFVSTNSICQGQQAVTLWKPLFEQGLRIQFAYKTFIWDSEANLKAHVHCVIVGFSEHDRVQKYIYEDEQKNQVRNINSYLSDAPNIFVESISTPLCDVPPIRFGSMPRDGGGFILTDEERSELLKKEPQSAKWIRPYIGAYEFINRKTRWCLWLVGATPHEIRESPTILHRVEMVKQFRENSKAEATRKFAQTPTLFCQIAQPNCGEYILVPATSSEKRKYIPMGYVDSNVICSNSAFLIPNATLFHFGVLTSSVHMAWMLVVAGRLKSDYRYAKDIVYNNFPWPSPTEEQRAKIEQTAQAILDARALYPDCSLADLYDDNSMPPELRSAHRNNDRAVMAAYGFSTKMTESECVAELMKMYKELTK